MRVGSLVTSEPDQAQEFLDPPVPVAAAPAADAEGDIAGHVQVGKQREILEHHAHVALLPAPACSPAG
jgi:hypothetical protein